MERRIQLEKGGANADEIVELNLSNCRSTHIVGLTNEFTALRSLILVNVGLTTLNGFPVLDNLSKLDLSDNRISTGLHFLHNSPKLEYLFLSGNKIKDMDVFKPLQFFKHLVVLDVFDNEATNKNDYRAELFGMLPSLKLLDGFDVSGDSNSDEEEEITIIEVDDDYDEENDQDSCVDSDICDDNNSLNNLADLVIDEGHDADDEYESNDENEANVDNLEFMVENVANEEYEGIVGNIAIEQCNVQNSLNAIDRETNEELSNLVIEVLTDTEGSTDDDGHVIVNWRKVSKRPKFGK